MERAPGAPILRSVEHSSGALRGRSYEGVGVGAEELNGPRDKSHSGLPSDYATDPKHDGCVFALSRAGGAMVNRVARNIGLEEERRVAEEDHAGELPMHRRPQRTRPQDPSVLLQRKSQVTRLP